MFLDEYKELNIKPLPDKELHQLLVKAIKYKDVEARNKVFLHILPIILNRGKKFFKNEYIVETMDFIQEVAVNILDILFRTFRIDEQEEGRCALFFKALNFYFLCALSQIKKKYLKRDDGDVKYKEIIGVCNISKEVENTFEEFDYNDLIEEEYLVEDLEENRYSTLCEFTINTSQGNYIEDSLIKKDLLEKIIKNNFNKIGISMLILLSKVEFLNKNYKRLLNKKKFFKKCEKNVIEWLTKNRERLIYG